MINFIPKKLFFLEEYLKWHVKVSYVQRQLPLLPLLSHNDLTTSELTLGFETYIPTVYTYLSL